jgi:PmbA protein
MKDNPHLTLKALQMAMDCGADSASATYECAAQSAFKARGKDIDSIFSSEGSSLSIRIYADGRYGSFSTNKLSDSDLLQFIKEGMEVVRLLEKDPCRSLPDPSACFKGELPDLKQCDAQISGVDSAFRRETVLECAAEAVSDPRVISIESEYDDMDDSMTLADSNGFFRTLRQTQFSISAECSIQGEGSSKPEGFWFDGSLMLKDFKPHGIGKEALRRAVSRLGSHKLPSGKYTAVLENAAASKLLSPVMEALNGYSLYQQNSFLLDKLGQKVFSESMSVYDDPLRPGIIGSRPFDAEGVACTRRKIVDEGTIAAYYIDTYCSQKLGMKQTVGGPSVLCIDSFGLPRGSAGNSESMLRAAEKGIFITGFNGGNCDTATGDFSYGIEGFYFEKGELIHPVSGMNITGNLVSLWNGFLAAGSDPRRCAKWQIPCLMFGEVDFNGI